MILIKISNSDGTKFIEIDEKRLIELAINDYVTRCTLMWKHAYNIREGGKFADINDRERPAKVTVSIEKNYSINSKE